MRVVVLIAEPRRGPVGSEEYVARARAAPGSPAVLRDPGEATSVVLDLMRDRRWHLGLGIGELDAERAARDGRTAGAVPGDGPAHVAAREAVLRARAVPARVAVAGEPAGPVERLETVLWLTAALLHRRTARGWEVADLLATGMTHRQVGDRLGISQSAVSQRARAAAVLEAQRAEDLLRSLVAEALAG